MNLTRQNSGISSIKNNIVKGFTNDLEKSHINQHESHSASGKLFNVKEHEDKREKHEEEKNKKPNWAITADPNLKVGGFGWKFGGKLHIADLYKLDEYDQDHYKGLIETLPEDIKLFRYTTDKMFIGGNLMMHPLIKINMTKKIVYLLDEHDKFETKGIKTSYLNTHEKPY